MCNFPLNSSSQVSTPGYLTEKVLEKLSYLVINKHEVLVTKKCLERSISDKQRTIFDTIF